jgi:hypothetical protein
VEVSVYLTDPSKLPTRQDAEGIVMPWCGAGDLADLWRDVGLRDVRFDALRVRASYTGFDALWSPFLTGVAPSGAFCRSLSDEGQSALRESLRRRVGGGDDAFELTPRAWAVAGSA